jgi:L,D-transpeptidase YbiS
MSDIDKRITVDIARQRLILEQGDARIIYLVSTAKQGAGEQYGSGMTPRGEHVIRLRIGDGCALNTVFVGRRPTGEIFSNELLAANPQRDWILTRILWLSGREAGFNRGGNVDSLRRYIYIHGTPDSEPMGVPLSHGCIRMRNSDVIDLFDRVETGTPVLIRE